jgi:hypothetical protein
VAIAAPEDTFEPRAKPFRTLTAQLSPINASRTTKGLKKIAEIGSTPGSRAFCVVRNEDDEIVRLQSTIQRVGPDPSHLEGTH